MVSDKLKQIIFKQLYKELSNIEIIPYKDSIYFIDRDKKYWYFEYEKSGMLWWRYDFFTNFFLIFSLEYNDYQKVMGEWVEEVLNCKVSTTKQISISISYLVEEVLNCKVSTTDWITGQPMNKVEEVLNYKVNTTTHHISKFSKQVEEILNHKVTSTNFGGELMYPLVGEILNYKVVSNLPLTASTPGNIEEILNEKN